MKVEQFEEYAKSTGLEPIEVVLGRGVNVVWFICLDRREEKQYGLIVFDSSGRALVMPTFDEEEAMETHIHICRYDDGVTVNGIPAERDSRLDMKTQEKAEA